MAWQLYPCSLKWNNIKKLSRIRFGTSKLWNMDLNVSFGALKPIILADMTKTLLD